MRVAVLASGHGSNLQALIDRVHRREGIEIVAVGSDAPGARALARAREAGIPDRAFPLEAHGGQRSDRDAAMAAWLADVHAAELIVLAGYLRVLSPEFLAAFPERVINVHPSLLPAFPGLHVVQTALDHGVQVFGATVHFVDEGIDTGPIIAQRAIELPDPRSAEQVLERLHPIEHELLIDAVRALAAGRLAPDPANPRRIRRSR